MLKTRISTRLLALAAAAALSAACGGAKDAAESSSNDGGGQPSNGGYSSRRAAVTGGSERAYSEQCSDSASKGDTSGAIGGAGENLAHDQSRRFDGAKGRENPGGWTQSTPVFAGAGRKCFSDFTQAASGKGLATSDVPLSLAKSQMREQTALSKVIPGGPVVMEAYREFQQQAYDKAYGVLDRLGWGARQRRGGASPSTPMRMTVHHTEGHTPQGEKDTARTLRDIQHYHMVGRAQEGKRAFEDIGYHFLIAGDGRVAQGRPSNTLGAHAYNANRGNLGIALMGNFMKREPTPDQMESLKRLAAYLAVKYHIDPKKSGALEGHSHHTATSCPGKHLRDKLAALRIAASEEMLAMLRRSKLAAGLAGIFPSRRHPLA